jgi:hypothetical protein
VEVEVGLFKAPLSLEHRIALGHSAIDCGVIELKGLKTRLGLGQGAGLASNHFVSNQVQKLINPLRRGSLTANHHNIQRHQVGRHVIVSDHFNNHL